MNTKHTPGPWEARSGKSAHVAIYQTGTSHDVAVGVSPANARLIASAPDLLAALKSLASTARTFRDVPQSEQQWTSIDDETLAAAFNAIAKATGVQS